MERAGQSSASNKQHLQNHSGMESSFSEGANKVQRVSYLTRKPSTNTQIGAAAHHSVYRTGSGGERLREYVTLQKNRPKDNNIQFWRNLVAQFFAPTATKRYCISSYKDKEEIDNIFKVTWKCNMCHSTTCYGFEVKNELLPKLHQNKYDVGILEELQVDTPLEYLGECGQIILHYHRATLESEYKHVRIVHFGQLRVVLSPDLKINSWEFCVEYHKEYIDRTFIIPQACQLEAAMKNYRHSAQNPSSATPEELRKHRDEFISSVDQMLTILSTSGKPLTSQIGVAKPYVRCIQISEVLNVIHNFIIYSQEHGLAANKNLVKFQHPSKNVPPGKYLNHQFEQHQPQTASLTPYFQECAGVGRSNGFYFDALRSMKTSSSERQIHHKKQHTFPSSTYGETPTQKPPICIPTPLFDGRPQMAHTTTGKSATKSAAAGFQSIGLGSMKTSSFVRPIHHEKLDTSPSSLYGETPSQTPPIRVPTPLFDRQPQMAHTTIGKSATESTAAGFCGNLGSITTSSSVRPIHQKKHSLYADIAENPTQTPLIGFPTPLYDIQPQMARKSIGKSVSESAVETVNMGPKTSASMQQPYHLNFDDPEDFYLTVDRIIQEVKADQSKNQVGITIHSDTKNNEGNNDVSAPEIGTTSGAQIGVDLFTKDAKGNCLPPDYNDELLFEFVDFGDLSELLN